MQPSSRPFLRSCARVACYLRFAAGPPVHGDIQIATGEMGVPGRNATGRFRRPEGRLLPTATALPIVSIACSIPLLRLAAAVSVYAAGTGEWAEGTKTALEALCWWRFQGA